MDVNNIEKKEDGWKLIVEEEYSLERIKNFVQSSCLAENEILLAKLKNITDTSDESVEELSEAFLEILDDGVSLDALTSLMVVACMIYSLENASIESMEIRTNLLYKVFQETDTMAPHHLHVAVERIWNSLKNDNHTSYVMLIISLCRELCIINETGKAIAIILAWTILCEITETDMEMFCFQKFSEINTMLKEIDEDILKLDESTQVVYILIQIVGFLINMIVFSPNDVFIKAGYRTYFKYRKQDLEKLKSWADQLANFLGAVNAKACNYWDLRMSMTEYVKMNIVSVLYDKIRDM